VNVRADVIGWCYLRCPEVVSHWMIWSLVSSLLLHPCAYDINNSMLLKGRPCGIGYVLKQPLWGEPGRMWLFHYIDQAGHRAFARNIFCRWNQPYITKMSFRSTANNPRQEHVIRYSDPSFFLITVYKGLSCCVLKVQENASLRLVRRWDMSLTTGGGKV
jgi:hypothetical protein